jgi:hypothetical protein
MLLINYLSKPHSRHLEKREPVSFEIGTQTADEKLLAD